MHQEIKLGWLNHTIIIIFAMLICGFISISLGKELCWDFVSYHYYIPYAYLHHRWDLDYWPSTYIHIFFNPTMDFVSYWLVTFFKPIIAEFILGAIHGLNCWLIFCIADLFVSQYQSKYRILISILLAVLGMYGPISFPEIGSFMGDNLISIFVLAAVYLQILFFQNNSSSKGESTKFILASGLIFGLGVGLKLAIAYIGIGIIIATLLSPVSLKLRFKITLYWCSAVGVGFLISYGHWMIFLWQRHHNPFFPLFNGLFHADGFPHVNWTDQRFFPKNVWQTLFYPFYFSWQGRMVCDSNFRDFTLPIIYALLIIKIILLKWKKTNRQKTVEYQWLLIFFVVNYLVWQSLFSIIRYFSSIEMLAPLIIYLLICDVIKKSIYRLVTLTLLFYFLIGTMHSMGIERVGWFGDNYFNIKLPAFVDKNQQGLVLVVTPNFSDTSDGFIKSDINASVDASFNITRNGPHGNDFGHAAILQTYLIPSFPKEWQFIGLTTFKHKYIIPSQLKEWTEKPKKKIFLLTTKKNMPSFLLLAKQLGLSSVNECGKIISDRLLLSHMHNEDVFLCSLSK